MNRVKDKELVEYFKEYGSYYAVAKETGLSASTVKERLNKLGYTSSYLPQKGKEWVKLSPSKPGAQSIAKGTGRQSESRVVSISGKFIGDMGFKPGEELYGRWKVNRKGDLVLNVSKEKSVEK
jgi:hypothetical protein